jgi:hypothetical protein
MKRFLILGACIAAIVLAPEVQASPAIITNGITIAVASNTVSLIACLNANNAGTVSFYVGSVDGAQVTNAWPLVANCGSQAASANVSTTIVALAYNHYYFVSAAANDATAATNYWFASASTNFSTGTFIPASTTTPSQWPSLAAVTNLGAVTPVVNQGSATIFAAGSLSTGEAEITQLIIAVNSLIAQSGQNSSLVAAVNGIVTNLNKFPQH